MKQLRLFIILQDKQKWRCSSLPPAPSTLCRWFLLETAYFWRFPDFLHVRPAKFKSRGLEATAYVILQALPHMGWSNQAIWKWRMFMSSWHVVCEYLPSGDRAWMASMAWSTGLSEGSVLGLGVSISLSDSQKKNTAPHLFIFFKFYDEMEVCRSGPRQPVQEAVEAAALPAPAGIWPSAVDVMALLPGFSLSDP